MIRGFSLLLAGGLVIVWAVGFHGHATTWLTWLCALAATGGFLVAAGPGVGPGHPVQPGGLVAVGAGLAVVSIIGFVRHAEHWLSGWALVFGFGFVLVGLAGELSRYRMAHPHSRSA
jgi:hypothetical protein